MTVVLGKIKSYIVNGAGNVGISKHDVCYLQAEQQGHLDGPAHLVLEYQLGEVICDLLCGNIISHILKHHLKNENFWKSTEADV